MKLLALLTTALACSAQSVIDLQEQKTVARVQRIEQSQTGSLGFYAIDLKTGRAFGHHADTVFPTASSIKIAILAQMHRAAASGKLSFDDKLTLNPKDAVGGSGHLKSLLRNGPLTLTIRDLATAMIETSDNTATNQCIRLVGMDNINTLLKESGLNQTKLQRIMLDSQSARENRENIATPAEMARLIEMVYKDKFPGGPEMLKTLQLVDGDFRKVVPDPITVSAKTGELPGARCETGIIFLKKHPFAMSVMSSFLDANENPVPDVARAVLEHFQKLEASNDYGNRLP